MKKRKTLFLGIVVLFFALANVGCLHQSNKLTLSLSGMKVKAAEAPIMDLDIKDGQTYTSSDIDVKGWALNESGVKAVDLYVDGNYTKSLLCNLSTPDVYKQFPDYNNSANCGYEYKLSLGNGTHSIKAYDIGNDGKVISKEVKVNVNASGSNDKLKPEMDLNIENGQTYTSSDVDVKGWAINQSGVKAVDLYVDGNYTKSLLCNLSTPDVYKQFSDYNNSANCGYEYTLSLSNGTHTIKTYNIGNDGKVISKEVSVTVNAPGNNSKLEPKMDLGIENGQTYTSSDVDVKGWALNESGVKAVDLYVDGKYTKTLNCNLSTPDVYAQFSNYEDSANCGYEYTLSLSNGSHTIKTYDIGNDGKVISKEVTISVNDPDNTNIQYNPSLADKMSLEINNGQSFSDGNIDIRGWALSGYGIKAVDLYVDGVYTKTLDCKLSRPDVDNAFPGYPNGINSGYDYEASLSKGTHIINVYAINNNGSNINRSVLVFVGLPNVGRTQSSIQLSLLNYLLLSRENRDSVKSAAITLHDGDASNTCVYFSSEALRRAGGDIPKWVANTHQYSDVLSSDGWKKSYDYKILIPGDICFTRNDAGGYPTHTYVFVGWVDDTYTTAYVVDNQDDLYGDELHTRVISYDTSSFDKFQYFFYK